MKILSIIFFTLFFASGLSAQQSKKATTKKSTAKKAVTTKYSDNAFIVNSVNADLMEIELGGFAEKYAADPRVKVLGSTMVRDHRRTKTELKSIATQLYVTVPDAMDAKHKARADALEKNKGADFDKQYIDMMVSDHAKDVADLRRAGALVKNQDLKDFMPRAITLNQMHLDSARVVQAYMRGK